MKQLEFIYNDGGRSRYYKAKDVGDCVVRATAIATGRDYQEVYRLYKQVGKESPRDGVSRSTEKKVLLRLGGIWHPCMTIGSGCTTHLAQDEIPMKGHIICSLSGHLVAIVDGVINDTYDCSRGGTRCVYGYWTFN